MLIPLIRLQARLVRKHRLKISGISADLLSKARTTETGAMDLLGESRRSLFALLQ
jgi:hypothetical protein